MKVVPVLPVVPELEAAPSDVVAEVDPDVEDVDPDFDVPDVVDVPVVPAWRSSCSQRWRRGGRAPPRFRLPLWRRSRR